MMLIFWSLLLTTVATAQTSGCNKAPPISGRHTIGNREYYIHIPTKYDSSQPTPLVILFHGWGYSGREWYSGGGSGAVSASPTADKEGFILISPTGITDPALRGNCDNGMGYCSWNGGGTTGSPGSNGTTCNINSQKSNYCYPQTCGSCADICWWTSCTDDVSFVHALLDQVETETCVDTRRVYAGGESNGGIFTWQLGMDARGSRFAAITPWIGLPHRGFAMSPATAPMPVMGIWGSRDRTIPPGNDVDPWTESGDGWYYVTGRTITKAWAQAHGCSTSGQPVPYPTTFDGQTGLACTAYSQGCTTGQAPVVDCRFNGGHVVNSYAPALMWEFMSKHVRN